MENNTIIQLGNWTDSRGLQLIGPIEDYLHDPSVIRVAVKETPPFAMRVTDENGTRYSGYAVDVLEEVARRLQFTFRFTVDSQQPFGARQPNGSWDGIIGDILTGSVDLAIGPLTVTAEREAVVDFTTPFYEFAGIEILIKEVSQEQHLLFFVTVFSEPMWGAWFGVLLLTGFLLAAFDYFSPFSARNLREREAKETFNLKEGLWLVTASFTLSGPESTPRTLSSRILVAGFWFFCSIIMANYTANLAAFLTTSRLTTPINSLQDLASQSEVRYSVVRGSVPMDYFQRMAQIESNFYELWKNISNNVLSAGDLGKSEMAVWDYPLGDTYVKIWSDIERTGLLSSSEEGLQKVMEGNFALIDEAPYLQYAISKHCGLTTIGKQFSTKSYAFALPQGSPLTELISNTILELQSETFLEKMKQKWWQATAEGCAQVDESDGLSFHTLGGVFLLAGVGLAAGLLLCLMESAWAWLSAWRKKEKSSRIPPINSRTDLVGQEFDMSQQFGCITSRDEERAVPVSSF
ncbi:ionotropic receptor 25a-like [Babylonia areolata]|uniref:ionotropic receptor 25a-like n=1 Tax=Babylonia areolata TaxID=304850 RepID=UPI003FD2AC8B